MIRSFRKRSLFRRSKRTTSSIIPIETNHKMESAIHKQKKLFLIYIDVIRLQELESVWGERVVTELIHGIWDIIQETAKRFFTESQLLNAMHIWGDDFVLCVTQGHEEWSPTDLEQKLEQFQSRLEYEVNVQRPMKTQQPIQFHIGYAAIPRESGSVEKRLYMALKEAMKWAKQNEPSPTGKQAQEFHEILEEKKITPVYQPVVSLKTGEIYGWEALSRGPVDSDFHSPFHLFQFAEKIGKLFELEKICREKALRHSDRFPEGGKLFLNMNPRAIDDPGFVKGHTAALLQDVALSPADVVFEITEKHSIDDFGQFRKSLRNYRTQGYLIAIDDMGAGHSNLQTVVELSPDFIKLDLSLITGIHRSRIKQNVIESIVTLAKKIHCKLIAEGIETEEELKTLIGLGIDYGQGFFLKKPAPDVSGITSSAKKVIEKEMNIRDRVAKVSNRKTVEAISEPVLKIGPEVTAEQVQSMFQKDLELSSVVVEEKGHLLGLVMRPHFFQSLSIQYGVPLFYQRPITRMMDKYPLCVDKNELMDTVSQKAMNRSHLNVYDDVLVMDGEDVLGMTTIKRLVEKMSESKIQMAKYANPLTGLPGNVRIDEELKTRLERDETFAVIYGDLNRFKQFNDYYGFEKGDQMISFTAQFFEKILHRYGTSKDFLGHIGGDDFLIITTPDHARALGQRAVRCFQAVMAVLNRNTGVSVSVSLACILCHKSWFDSHLQISETVAQAKREAKSRQDNAFVESKPSYSHL